MKVDIVDRLLTQENKKLESLHKEKEVIKDTLRNSTNSIKKNKLEIKSIEEQITFKLEEIKKIQNTSLKNFEKTIRNIFLFFSSQILIAAVGISLHTPLIPIITCLTVLGSLPIIAPEIKRKIANTEYINAAHILENELEIKAYELAKKDILIKSKEKKHDAYIKIYKSINEKILSTEKGINILNEGKVRKNINNKNQSNNDDFAKIKR